MELLNHLIKYGFSEKEAKVYLSTLMLGISTVNEIAKKAQLVRTTTYDILKILKEQGFVSYSELNNIFHFEAVHPRKLIEILETKQKEITKIIPKLAQLKEETIPRPRVRLFEGKKGIISVFEELLEAKKPLFAFSNNRATLKIVPFYGPHFIKKRIKLKIPIKILCEDSAFSRNDLLAKDTQEFRETRILKKFEKTSFTQYIFGDSVAFLGTNEKEPTGIIITHKEFADSQMIIFEEMWNTALTNK